MKAVEVKAMDFMETDPFGTPAAIRVARPLIDRFCDSRFCPGSQRWHARTTLPVLALFVGMTAEPTTAGLGWGGLEPDELLSASLDIDPNELAFNRDLLDVSASFYAFLGAEGLVRRDRAAAIRKRLVELALAFC